MNSEGRDELARKVRDYIQDKLSNTFWAISMEDKTKAGWIADFIIAREQAKDKAIKDARGALLQSKDLAEKYEYYHWIEYDESGESVRACPDCGVHEDRKHFIGCDFGKALNKINEALKQLEAL